jgi:arylsulfatase
MDNDEKYKVSRREFIKTAGVSSLALGTGMGTGALTGLSAQASTIKASTSQKSPVKKAKKLEHGAYNILFILTDQERYFDAAELPAGYTLPGRERLQQRGVTFNNHQINSAVCTSSRSVIYTGQHIQHTKLFDNLDFPWSNDLDPELGTIGNLLGEAGYYCAYKGKWHMSAEVESHDMFARPQERLNSAIEKYGFKDYVGIGDVIGMTQGAYLNDGIIGAQAKRWMRLRGKSMNDEGKPWFQAVNLVNPHDVMFYNTDAVGKKVQADPKPLMSIAREPDTHTYQQKWDVKLPDSRHESFDKKGRPQAHKDYQLGRGAMVGNFPDEDVRWKKLLNYYLNCIKESDKVVEDILNELEELGLADNTIIVMTSDHGELGGSHGSYGKGATCYQEQNHVPLIISHPAYTATHGQRCGALTSHLDLVPSMVSWTGVDKEKQIKITRKLHGKDLTRLLEQGSKANLTEIREASLFCFNMFIYLDSAFPLNIQTYLNSGGDPEKMADQGYRPDFYKRGAIRSIFDGRYKYSRYFSPKQHNKPVTIKQIFSLNDVELFDLKADPHEMNNLAVDREKNNDLLLAMNEKMNRLIDAEVHKDDDGSFLPGKEANWAAITFDP